MTRASRALERLAADPELLFDELAERYSADVLASIDRVLSVRYRGAYLRAARVLDLARSRIRRFAAWLSD